MCNIMRWWLPYLPSLDYLICHNVPVYPVLFQSNCQTIDYMYLNTRSECSSLCPAAVPVLLKHSLCPAAVPVLLKHLFLKQLTKVTDLTHRMGIQVYLVHTFYNNNRIDSLLMQIQMAQDNAARTSQVDVKDVTFTCQTYTGYLYACVVATTCCFSYIHSLSYWWNIEGKIKLYL